MAEAGRGRLTHSEPPARPPPLLRPERDKKVLVKWRLIGVLAQAVSSANYHEAGASRPDL